MTIFITTASTSILPRVNIVDVVRVHRTVILFALSTWPHQAHYSDWSAHLAEHHDTKQHYERVQLLVNEVEGEHAVDKGSREENQTEQNCDW